MLSQRAFLVSVISFIMVLLFICKASFNWHDFIIYFMFFAPDLTSALAHADFLHFRRSWN